MSDQTYLEEPIKVTKIITIIENANNEAQSQIYQEHFEKYSDEQVKVIVAEILQNSSERVRKEAEEVREYSKKDTLFVPINPGGLYDDIIFESSIYVTEDSEIIVNTSFGRLYNPKNFYHDALIHASEVIAYVGGLILSNGEGDMS